MRTTVIINDEILDAAKRKAVERKSSLSALINEALRRYLQPNECKTESSNFRMPTFHGQGDTIDTTPSEMSELEEMEALKHFSNG